MRYLFFILLLLAVFSPRANAAERVAGPIRAEVLRVVDGDTLAVRALIWPGQRVEVKVRLAKVNAPELFRSSCPREKAEAKKASAFVADNIGAHVDLRDIRFGKYAGRVVADIDTDDGRDLGELLLAAGLARPYGEKANWCDRQS